jgi:hypothetical protein
MYGQRLTPCTLGIPQEPLESLRVEGLRTQPSAENNYRPGYASIVRELIAAHLEGEMSEATKKIARWTPKKKTAKNKTAKKKTAKKTRGTAR